MNPSEELFLLIKSMKAPEKKHFRMQVTGGSGREKDYVKLFDAIDKQKKYDEGRLKSALTGEPLLKRLPATKNYLYHAILQSMVAYRCKTRRECRARRMYDFAMLLLEKGLIRQSEKFLAKSGKVAEAEEDFPLRLDIALLERKILHQKLHYEPGHILKKTEISFRKYKEMLGILHNQNAYWHITEQIFALQSLQFVARDNKALRGYSKLVRHPLMSDENKALSVKARFYYYAGMGTYYRMAGDEKQAYRIYKKHVDYIAARLEENNTELIRAYPVALRNLIITQVNNGLYDEAQQYISKLQDIGQDVSHGFAFRSCIVLTMYLLSATGRFAEGVEHIKRVEKESFTQAFGGEGRADLPGFYYYAACIFLGAGKFRDALAAINNLYAHDIRARPDLHSFGRLLNLIIHYELQNDQALPHFIISTYRYLRKKGRLYGAESAILRFLKRLAGTATRQELIHLFTELRAELIPLQNDPYEKNAFAYFDFISWLQSKIEGRPFDEMVRGKAARSQSGE